MSKEKQDRSKHERQNMIQRQCNIARLRGWGGKGPSLHETHKSINNSAPSFCRDSCVTDSKDTKRDRLSSHQGQR